MNKKINHFKNKSYKTVLIKLLISIIGVAFVGFGIAFNAEAMLGNDPVAVLYDGVRSILGFSPDKLGMVTNFVNYTLMVIVFILGRKYINIGTFIYTIPMGTFVSLGSKIHELVGIPDILVGRVFTSICGCSMLFLGIGIFIAINVGMDPCTGMVMILKDRIKHEYKVAKVICDLLTLIIGVSLGGKFGIVTVIVAFIAGPTIQKVSEVFDRMVIKKINLNDLIISNS